MLDEKHLQLLFDKRTIMYLLNITVLALSIVLILMISIDTFNNINFDHEPKFLRWQFWICVVFMSDFFIGAMLADRKWHYIWTNIIFLLVSIPYQVLVIHFDIGLPEKVMYMLRYMPLIRGGYAMAYVITWFTNNRATGLFLAYIIIMLSMVYFASLTFYLFEFKVNPDIKKYTDALWWASMAVTTEGSSISPMTSVGRVLNVMLAVLGIIMFPVFTVYVTNLINRKQKEANARRKMVLAYQQIREEKKANKAGVSAGLKDSSAGSGKTPAKR